MRNRYAWTIRRKRLLGEFAWWVLSWGVVFIVTALMCEVAFGAPRWAAIMGAFAYANYWRGLHD